MDVRCACSLLRAPQDQVSTRLWSMLQLPKMAYASFQNNSLWTAELSLRCPVLLVTKAIKLAAMSTHKVPKGWPQDVIYLTTPRISRSLSSSLRTQLNTPQGEHAILKAKTLAQLPSSMVRIAKISMETHPAHGQYGLFATRGLAPDTFILCYHGYVHSEEETDVGSNYDLSLHRELGIGIDATSMGNEARFINDYRGVTPNGPNAEFREVFVEMTSGQLEKRMAIYVLPAGKSGKRAKGISKGDEILVSYGKGFWTKRSEGT
jgi:hypothetical protein